MYFYYAGNKAGRISVVWVSRERVVFRQVNTGRNIPKDLFYHGRLLLGYRSIGIGVIDQLHAISRTNVSGKPSPLFCAAGIEVFELGYQPGHLFFITSLPSNRILHSESTVDPFHFSNTRSPKP